MDRAAVAGRGPLHGSVFRHNATDIRRPEANVTHRWSVDRQWKLIVPREGAAQLYDVVADPEEKDDRAGSEEARVRAMTAALDAWWPQGK
jgi:uncharacterized sulfatase